MKQVFQRLQDAGLTIKLKKYAFSVLDSARTMEEKLNFLTQDLSRKVRQMGCVIDIVYQDRWNLCYTIILQ